MGDGDEVRAVVVERMPTVDEHRRLFEAQGWTWYGADRVDAALHRSTHGAVVELDGQVVGMGRIVGDGATFHYVQDVVVAAQHRGRGLGRAIMASLLDQIRSSGGAPAVVGLFSTPEAIDMYRTLGFGEPELHGMAMRLTDVVADDLNGPAD